jgi:serine/threonine-protein kinase
MDATSFGRYRLVELLGRGGMGEVWRAYDTTIDRVVALKLLPAIFADDRVFQERFRREARAAAGLDEPHVVPIFDFGEIDGRLYVTMRLIKGRDLQVLLDDGPLSPARTVGIIEQIASALHAAHEVGLVHRDIKPSNILVAHDDFAYLIDFGIARAAGETGLTSTGATVGTWAYMAPERFQTGKADARVDIYALTCVLYQALTGQLPFPGESLEQVAVAHMLQPPPQPSQLGTGVTVAMDDVIATGMAKEPEQRYATTKDLAHAARAAQTTPTGQDGIPAAGGADAPRPSHRDVNGRDSSTRAGGASAIESTEKAAGVNAAGHSPEHDALGLADADIAIGASTQAAPTAGIGGAAAEQAPVSNGGEPTPAAASAATAARSAQRQRLRRRTKIALAGGLVFVAGVAAVVVAFVAGGNQPSTTTPLSPSFKPSEPPTILSSVIVTPAVPASPTPTPVETPTPLETPAPASTPTPAYTPPTRAPAPSHPAPVRTPTPTPSGVYRYPGPFGPGGCNGPICY